jgi:hypothetical protein
MKVVSAYSFLFNYVLNILPNGRADFLFPDTQNWELLTITLYACQGLSDQQSKFL